MGAALILMAGALWSLQGLLIRLIEVASPEQIVFWRNLGQFAALMAALAYRSRGRVVLAFRTAGPVAVLGGVCQMISSVTVVFAFVNTTVASVVFIMSASPFMAAILAWIFLGERLRRATLLFMTAGLMGVGVMMAEGLAGGGLLGNFYALICTLGFAALSVVLRWGRRIDMLPAVCWGGGLGTVAGLVLCGGEVSVPLADGFIAVAMGAGLVSVGLIAFTAGARYVPAGVLAFLSLSEVVLAPVWAWLGVDEVPSVVTLVGGAIVLGAIILEASANLRRKGGNS
jgi:drug/metabolite transporter (DMT)-like permease